MRLAHACSQLPGALRRGVALIAVPLGIIFVAYAAFSLVRLAYDAQQDWRSHASRMLAQTKSAAQVQVHLDQQLLVVNTSALWPKLYGSSTSGGSAALLQSDVSNLLGSAQVSVQSLAPIPSTPMAEFTQIGVRLTASMRIDQLKSFLAAATIHTHYLRVGQLTVVSPQMQTAADNPPLAVTMDVYGYELAANRGPAVNGSAATVAQRSAAP